MKRAVGICILIMMAVLLPVCSVKAEESKDLSRTAVFTCENRGKKTTRINDKDMCTSFTVEAGEHLNVRAGDKQALGWLFLRFCGIPEPFTLTELGADGSVIKTGQIVSEGISMPVELSEGCRSVELCCETAPLVLAEFSLYSVGTLPESVPVFSAALEKTDMLIITTHPDDEWLFLGAVYPIFCHEQGHTGTFAYLTTPSWGRLHEALNGLYSAGVRELPYFLGFEDIDRSEAEKRKAEFTEEDVTLSLVRLYRKIQPLVVVTQDPIKGEYGHWQHIIGANAALKAAELAANPDYDPDSAAEYGTWSPLKVYRHMVTENGITLDCTSPLASYDGQNALSVAKTAYKYHKSQQKYSFTPSIKNGNYGDLRLYGLDWSTVGADTGNDMFENIPEELFGR